MGGPWAQNEVSPFVQVKNHYSWGKQGLGWAAVMSHPNMALGFVYVGVSRWETLTSLECTLGACRAPAEPREDTLIQEVPTAMQ